MNEGEREVGKRSKDGTHIGMWMSLTKYPMKPMTAKPIATALEIWINSAPRTQCQKGTLWRSPSLLRTFMRRLGAPGEKLENGPQVVFSRASGRVRTWLPSRTNCWGMSTNSLSFSDMMEGNTKDGTASTFGERERCSWQDTVALRRRGLLRSRDPQASTCQAPTRLSCLFPASSDAFSAPSGRCLRLSVRVAGGCEGMQLHVYLPL